MTRQTLGDRLCADEFLVCYDLPRMSGLWGVLIAASADEIRSTYPEVVIVDHQPRWMTDDRLAQLRQTPLSIHEAPQGLLKVVVADRGRD